MGAGSAPVPAEGMRSRSFPRLALRARRRALSSTAGGIAFCSGWLAVGVFVSCNGWSRAPLKGRTIMVHNGVMGSANKTVRQSVSLPATTAAKVRSLAKTRRLSANRMIVELIENGIEAEKRKQQEFFELAERFRDASDPEEAKRLGDELGRMVFGG
jgi:hypothetical protein